MAVEICVSERECKFSVAAISQTNYEIEFPRDEQVLCAYAVPPGNPIKTVTSVWKEREKTARMTMDVTTKCT